MKVGTENRKKTIFAGALISAAVLAFGYQLWGLMGGGSPPTPPPTIAPLTTVAQDNSSGPPVDSLSSGPSNTNSGSNTGPAIAGVDARKLSTNSSSLDPTLDEAAMLRTEDLHYAGNGRNIFSADYTPVVAMPTNVPSARPNKKLPPPVPAGPPPPPPTCPPQCPPLPIKFFGTEKFPGGRVEGFFLNNEDVYMAAEGEIIARRYKIVSVAQTTARVQDLTTTFEQTLPLQSQ
jgi:hypothetical protein